MQTALVCVGIDISKAQLDIAVEPGGESLTVPYNGPGLATLITRLSQLAPRRSVVEATGGLERALLRALVDAALPVIAVNPRKCGTLPRRRANWRRPTHWMRLSWRALRS